MCPISCCPCVFLLLNMCSQKPSNQLKICLQVIPNSGPASGLPQGQMREDLPKQANRIQIILKWCGKNNDLSDNHQSSVNQPIFILPYCDQQCHGKGEAGGTFFLGWLLKNCQNTSQMNFRDWWQISCKRRLSASPGRALRLPMF